MKIYYDKDADLSLIKRKHVAIIGYGSQGHAHANNLKESGVKVSVGVRKGGASWNKAKNAGLPVKEVGDAVQGADIVMILLPDEHHAQVYREEMKRMADIFRGRIIDVTEKDYTIELTGTGAKLDAFLKAIERGAILETVRTGASGIGRGDRILRV